MWSQFEGDDGSHVTSLSRVSLTTACKLLVITEADLERCLTTRRLDVGGSIVEKELPPKQAKHTRNALAKYAYGKMFEWIVQRTNNFLGDGDGRKGDSFVGRCPCDFGIGFLD